MDATIKGPWEEAKVREFLSEATFPMRLASSGVDGFPRVASLWYRFDGEQLLCVTHGSSGMASLLRNCPKIGFEVSPNEPPYCGVRGQGLASLEPLGQNQTLEQLLGRYLGGSESSLARWLLSRSDEEVLIRITPVKLFTWDYSQRMADAMTAQVIV